MSHLSLTGRLWNARSGHESLLQVEPTSVELVHMLKTVRSIGERTEKSGVISPDYFSHAGAAADRMRRAIDSNETIGIFGDYDCDGVTGVAQLVRYCKRHNTEPIVRLPHRVHDGYGLKPNHSEEFAEKGCSLLVTIDTGASANPAIARAKELGMDTIILDHHSLPPELPVATYILHPGLSNTFGMAAPSAAGVVLSFIAALEESLTWEGYEEDIALAAIGTVADLVPLLRHNRQLVQHGLTCLRALPKTCPLGELIELLGLDRESINAMDIGFRIAPRINAAGRLDDPTIALEAMLSGGEKLLHLDRINTERQLITQENMEIVEKEITLQAEHPFLIVCGNYAPGIVGLLAGRLTEQSGKPSLVAAVQDGVCTASLRSPAGYHVTNALRRIEKLLITFGGHAQAAGCTFAYSMHEEVTRALRADIAGELDVSTLQPTYEIDATIDSQHVSIALCNELSVLEPYGQGNPEPRFLLRNCTPSQVRRVGKEGQHLQLSINGIKAIAFRLGYLESQLSGAVDVACRVGIDTWQNIKKPQLFVDDLRLSVSVASTTAV